MLPAYGALKVLEGKESGRAPGAHGQTTMDGKQRRQTSQPSSIGINIQTAGSSQKKTIIKPGDASRQHKERLEEDRQLRNEEQQLRAAQMSNSARPRMSLNELAASRPASIFSVSANSQSRNPSINTSLKQAVQSKNVQHVSSLKTQNSKIDVRTKQSSNNIKSKSGVGKNSTVQPILARPAVQNWSSNLRNNSSNYKDDSSIKGQKRSGIAQSPSDSNVVDLVSDDDEGYEGEGPDLPVNNTSCRGPAWDTDSGELCDTFQEQFGPANELDAYVLIDSVYLGKRQLSTDYTPESESDIKIFARITNYGLQVDIPSTLKFADASKPKGLFEHEELAAVLTVPASEINRSYASSKAQAQSSETFYFAFDLLGASSENSSLSKHIAVGVGKSLDPGSKNSSSCPAQYILLVISGTNSYSRGSTFLKQLHSCVSRFRVKNVQNITSEQLFVEKAHNTLKQKWTEEAYAEMVRHERSAQRAKRRRSTTSSMIEIGEQSGDNETYLVYPCGMTSAASVVPIADEGVLFKEQDKEKDKRICITRGDMRRLDPPMYLNDTIIDFKILHMLLNEYSHRRKQVHCFQSFFYTRLNDKRAIEDGYKNVATWTKTVDIFEKDMIILPVNHTSHWSVLFLLRPDLLLSPALSDVPSGTMETSEPSETACILCLDSLSMHNTKSIAAKTKGYLLEEFLHKKCAGIRGSKFFAFKAAVDALPVVAVKDIPTQANGYDCGMYIIKYVEVFLSRWPRSNMETIRKRFTGLFGGEEKCSEDDITLARVQMRSLLEEMKPIYDAARRAEVESERLDKIDKLKRKRASSSAGSVASHTTREEQVEMDKLTGNGLINDGDVLLKRDDGQAPETGGNATTAAEGAPEKEYAMDTGCQGDENQAPETEESVPLENDGSSSECGEN